MLTFCAGCALFKKGTKVTTQHSIQTIDKSYLDRVELKTASKETKIYSYWKDSALYQYRHILENTEAAEHTASGRDTKQTRRQQQHLKKTEPPDLWLYGAGIITVAAILLLSAKFWLKRNHKLS